MAQADSSVIHDYANTGNTVDENKPAANEEYPAPGVRINQNPVKDLLQIDGLDASVKSIISVSSSYGRVVFQSRSSGSASYSANVGKLKPGFYFVTIKYKDNSILLRFLKV